MPDQIEMGQVPEQNKDQESDEFDKERAMATIKKLREFEKGAKSQLKELEGLKAEKQKAEEARLSETEKLNKRAAEAEKQAQEARDQLAQARREQWTIKLASEAGAHDPLDANIMAALNALDPNATDAEKEMRQAIEALKKGKPWLFKGAQRLEPMNPAGPGGAAETDQQKIARITNRGGAGSWGPLGP